MIAAILRGTPHSREIAAGSGFRHGYREDFFSPNASRQPSGLLFLIAQLADIGRDQTGMQLDIESGLPIPDILLVDDLLEAKIIYAGGAVFFLGPHEQETLLARLGECPSIDESLLAPFLGMRRNLVLKEAARGRAKFVMLGFEDEAAHG